MTATFDLTITAIGARGDGLAAQGADRFFVPFTVPGDRVRVRARERSGEGIRAEIVEVIEAGADRVPPPCPHYGTCGGCSLQHLADPAYAAWKTARVGEVLDRAGISEIPTAALARTPPQGRRRARFAAIKRGHRVYLGFNQRQSHRLTNLETCPVLNPELLSLLPSLRDALAEALADGAKLDVMVTRVDTGIDVLLIGPRQLERSQREKLTAAATTLGLARMAWKPDDRADAEPIAHAKPTTLQFGSLLVASPPGAFLQASREGERALATAVVEAARGGGRVGDLFCGLGTFSGPLLDLGAAVHAVENDGPAVTALSRAVQGQRLTVERRDLFETPFSAKDLARFDAVVFDPPRAGAAAQAAELAKSGVPVIAAVSCNPTTFARDVRTLIDGGYQLERLTPVDQFLWSHHVEVVGHLTRSGGKSRASRS